MRNSAHAVEDDPGWVSAGYFIGLRQARSPYMSADLVPEKVVSGSDCITPRVPNAWAYSEVTYNEEERVEHAARFGLDEPGRVRFMAWADAALDSGDIGWRDVFCDVTLARRVRAELLPPNPDIVIFGLALPADLLEEATTDDFDHGGVYQCLVNGKAPAPGGVEQGYEILGWDMGGFHSSLCHGLERRYVKELGIELGPHGRPTTLEDARRCADHTNLDTSGAEPVLWLPWRFTEYPDGPSRSAV